MRINLLSEQQSAVNFIDNILMGYRGSLCNHSAVKVIKIFKQIILQNNVEMHIDEISLQDVLAIVLNKMIPNYQVMSFRSKGRNLITYYKFKDNHRSYDHVNEEIKAHLLKAISKVNCCPHH